LRRSRSKRKAQTGCTCSISTCKPNREELHRRRTHLAACVSSPKDFRSTRGSLSLSWTATHSNDSLATVLVRRFHCTESPWTRTARSFIEWSTQLPAHPGGCT